MKMSVEHCGNRTNGENELYLTCTCLRSISLYCSERQKTNRQLCNDEVCISMRVVLTVHLPHEMK